MKDSLIPGTSTFGSKKYIISVVYITFPEALVYSAISSNSNILSGDFFFFLNAITVGSRFATVRFTTIHFYDPGRVRASTPDVWFITVATQAFFLYLVRF